MHIHQLFSHSEQLELKDGKFSQIKNNFRMGRAAKYRVFPTVKINQADR